ncbi:protein kinase [Nonomuraea sp. NPDC049725]|uniref:serine/threonine-protein kinase n=1 Tax=Nonomuraea sp. NPDC049725 TaxID=3154508 RepID=UPI0034306BC8
MEVPGYTEIRELGRGGTGHVTLAVRDSDGTAVAVKHLSDRLREDPVFAARFRAEARVIAELDSPHIARLLDYVEDEAGAAIVMELVDGVPLRRLLGQEGGTGPEAALAVLKGALLGLAEAHRHGIVHRDFKPENVIVTDDGGSRLVDFGVAARAGEAGPPAGTPPYMAPERWDDAPAGPRSDVYAAAAVFYECLTGRRPFTGDNVAALAHQHRHAVPDLGAVDEPVRGLVLYGLAKDPAERPGSAEAFLAELERVASVAYGSRWEARGRSRLGALTVPFLTLRTPQPAPGAGALPFPAGLAPASRLAVTGGLVLATAVAVVSVFLIWNETPGPRYASPPATSQPAPVPGSGSPEPTASGWMTPPVRFTAPPGTPPARDPARDPARAATFGPTAPPARTPDAHRPTRDAGPGDPAPTDAHTDAHTGAPTKAPATAPAPTGTAGPDEPDEHERPEPEPGPGTERPDPPATSAPPPPPSTRPPAKSKEPLVSVSVKVSVDVPVLGGKGDGLLDADVGLGLGTSLFGVVLVPGSVLLGRHLAVRRTRRNRPPDA